MLNQLVDQRCVLMKMMSCSRNLKKKNDSVLDPHAPSSGMNRFREFWIGKHEAISLLVTDIVIQYPTFLTKWIGGLVGDCNDYRGGSDVMIL